jgi:hypothetical protein
MSNVIDFLERMGKDAQLRHASRDQLAFALEGTQIEAPMRSAIVAGDASQLQVLMGQGPLYAVQMISNGQ